MATSTKSEPLVSDSHDSTLAQDGRVELKKLPLLECGNTKKMDGIGVDQFVKQLKVIAAANKWKEETLLQQTKLQSFPMSINDQLEAFELVNDVLVTDLSTLRMALYWINGVAQMNEEEYEAKFSAASKHLDESWQEFVGRLMTLIYPLADDATKKGLVVKKIKAQLSDQQKGQAKLLHIETLAQWLEFVQAHVVPTGAVPVDNSENFVAANKKTTVKSPMPPSPCPICRGNHWKNECPKNSKPWLKRGAFQSRGY